MLRGPAHGPLPVLSGRSAPVPAILVVVAVALTWSLRHPAPWEERTAR
jgi:hypothetical protein